MLWTLRLTENATEIMLSFRLEKSLIYIKDKSSLMIYLVLVFISPVCAESRVLVHTPNLRPFVPSAFVMCD